MRIIVFGTGQIYKQNRHKLAYFDVVAYWDNDVAKQGEKIDGVIIDKPENHFKYSYDSIIIMCADYVSVRKQLLSLGILSEKIIDIEHLGVFNECIIKQEYITRKKSKSDKAILLFSYELTNTGAAIALLNMAKILIKHGYQVDLVSCKKGPLLYDYILCRINVYLFEWDSMIPDDFFYNYDVIVINTVLLYKTAKRLSKMTVPVLWWWHEDIKFCEQLGISSNSISLGRNIYPFAVSKRVKKAYNELTGCLNMQDLELGIEEYKCSHVNEHSEIICAVIGNVSKMKGHDILLSAIEKNYAIWKNRIVFWLVGTIAEKERALFEKYKCVKIWGSIDHNRLLELFSSIDIVLCVSRFESLSIAVLEGMMQKKLCIVSKETGIAEYCKAYENAILIDSENVESLTEGINWALEDKDKWKKIIENGYKVYQNYFTMDKFEERIVFHIKKLMACSKKDEMTLTENAD